MNTVPNGHFDRLDGRLEVDRDGRLQVALTIGAASLHTRNPIRDRHLRAADFFDVERYPEMRQRLLGMTWSPLGMTRTPALLRVHALLQRER